mgnify:CR=1 FL=1
MIWVETIINGIPSWGEFHNYKPIFGPDGKMYFFLSTQGNAGTIDAHWIEVMRAFDKTDAHDSPCEDVVLTGQNYEMPDLRTEAAGDSTLTGVYVGLEGDDAAVRAGTALAATLGARPVVLTAGEKLQCHLAAAIASNFTVTLQAMAAEVLAAAGIDRARGAAMLRPLVEGTWRNLAHQIPEDALTGPIARGDHGTVRDHLAALARHTPQLTPAYVALSVETVRLAVRAGRLSEDEARQLLDALHAAVEPQRDPLF